MRHAAPLADGHIPGLALSPADDALQVSVTDGGGSTRPRNVHASTSALAGRGMAIVEVLRPEWWIERIRLAHHRARPARSRLTLRLPA